MRYYSIMLASAIFLSGCNSVGAFGMFKMDKMHERSIEQLRTSSIVLSMETKAIVSTLYLNKVDPQKYSDGENFIISVYIEKDHSGQKTRDLENSGYYVTLNDNNATKIEKLDDNDPKRELLPIKNQWNQYYFVRFDRASSDNLNLKFQKDNIGIAQIQYQK